MRNVILTPSSYRYFCTRITLRKKNLITTAQYNRLLNMDISQIIRFIGETDYHEEINSLSSSLSGLILVEAALSGNLARTYRSIIDIAPGAIKELTVQYFSRWDIENVLLIMRGCQFAIPSHRICDVLIPAGVISKNQLEELLTLSSIEDVVKNLIQWEYYHIVADALAHGYRKGMFAELENRLYQAYYKKLLDEALFGIRGGNMVLPHLRFEIDITNVRTVFRLRAGSRTSDIRPYIIPGGNQHIEDYQRLYLVDDRDEFIREMERARILKILTEALRDLRCDQSVCEADAAQVIWRRWADRKTPLYTVMLAVNRMLLHHLDGLSRRYPFSVTPVLSYLEHKRYEVLNLRAIVRGKQFGVNPDFIRQHLVM